MKDLLNFCQLTPQVGTSGQPTVEQFAEVAALGYDAVVNLAMPDSDNAVADEGGIVTTLGMSYFHIPVPFDKPTADQLRQFSGLMDVLEGSKVLVHCAVNARVSAFMYQYLTLCKNQSAEQSTTPLLQKWLPQMDDTWKDFLMLGREDITRAGSEE